MGEGYDFGRAEEEDANYEYARDDGGDDVCGGGGSCRCHHCLTDRKYHGNDDRDHGDDNNDDNEGETEFEENGKDNGVGGQFRCAVKEEGGVLRK